MFMQESTCICKHRGNVESLKLLQLQMSLSLYRVTVLLIGSGVTKTGTNKQVLLHGWYVDNARHHGMDRNRKIASG